jgi:hypothetical protein
MKVTGLHQGKLKYPQRILNGRGFTEGFTPSELGEMIRTLSCKGSCDVMQNFIVTYNDVPGTSLASVLTPLLSPSVSSLEFKPGDNFSFYDKLFSCHHISLPHTPKPAFPLFILPSFLWIVHPFRTT